MPQEMGDPGYPPGDAMQERGTEQGAGEGEHRLPDAPRGDLDAETIRRRAYEISQGSDAGTDEENWLRAEREIRTEQASP
jgi:hypothetical protein